MSYMRKLVHSYQSKNLMIRIFVGMVLGAILGISAQSCDCSFLDKFAGFASILGNFFVGALKAVAPILVFILVMSSIMVKDFSNTRSGGA